MTFLQATLIGIIAALSQLEGGWLGECKLREPIVTGALVGLVMGNLSQGLIIGAELQLIFMGAASIGPTAGLSVGPGGTLGAAIALATGSGIEVAMTFAVPASVLLQFLQTILYTFYSSLMHKVDNLIDDGNREKEIILIHYFCGLVEFIVFWGITFVALYIGNDLISSIVDNIPAWMTNGLNAVAKVLPSLGFALLLNMLMEKELIPYFVIGFALTAWLSMSMIGVAAVSIAIALVIYQIKSEQLELNNRINESHSYEEEL